MKRLLFLFAFAAYALATPAAEVVADFAKHGEFEAWCKAKTEEALVARGEHPSDWSVSMYSQLGDDMLHVWASWKVETRGVRVMCRVRRGSTFEHASYEIEKER